MFVFAIWAKVLVGVSAVVAISAPVIYTVANQKVVEPVKGNAETNASSYLMTEEEQKKYNEHKATIGNMKTKIKENEEKIKQLTQEWHVSEVASASSKAETNDFEWVAMWRKDFVKGIKEKYESLKNRTDTLTNLEQSKKQELNTLIEDQKQLFTTVNGLSLEMDRLNSYKS